MSAQNLLVRKSGIYHCVLSFGFFAQAAYISCVTPSGDVNLTVSYARYSENGKEISVARRNAFRVDVVSLVYLFLVASSMQHAAQGLCHIIHRTRVIEHYETFGVFWLRWIDYLLTAPVMMIVVGVMNGIYDVYSLLALFGSQLLTIALGVLSDVCLAIFRAPETPSKRIDGSSPRSGRHADTVRAVMCLMWAFLFPVNAFASYCYEGRVCLYVAEVAWGLVMYFALSMWMSRDGFRVLVLRVHSSRTEDMKWLAKRFAVAAILPCVYAWAIIFATFAIAVNGSEGEPPEYVYAINVVTMLLFLGPFPYFHFMSILSMDNAFRLRMRCETGHATFGFFSKSALAWLVYWGVRRIQEDVVVS
ncbi:hypothetical protein CYMTET_35646 [Cymbomonas tetramitiformis]|uniref:Uncharacterized protein n=1 Tax=Cymbomonas tetramitiformis TaxID=36881 RepID=A0AAE0F8T4_9CHLO|nr:hypothetical protein CYMTET_35646 [Cymbomonas tetramitiformis]|eukprot:gene48-70_t